MSEQTSSCKHCLAAVDIFVLAGGLGTRIQPVLGDLPKLLAPIAGRPFLEILVDWLKRFGARRVILGLGHRADAVLDYLKANPPADLQISTTVEPRPLGTAGAVRFVRGKLHSEPALVMNGDTVIAEANLCDLIEAHQKSGSMGTLLCARVKNAERYGRVLINDSKQITAFVEKDPACRHEGVVNAGVYVVSQSLLDRIATSSAVSIERDIFERLPLGSFSAYITSGELIDIGTPESLAQASQIAERDAQSRVRSE